MSLYDFIQSFHFLRPLWLLAIIPAALLAFMFWQQKSKAANWQGAIDSQLLAHLTEGKPQQLSRWPWLVLLAGWLIAALALAGPSWKKLPQPILQKQDALVIVLDLSYSMLAEDIKPSRLVRAKHKVLDLLKQRSEGLTGLVAYSGDAHVVSPLTDDNDTIANLAPALSPEIMPVLGSNPVAALNIAQQLFSNAGAASGRILLITDGISKADVSKIDDTPLRKGLELSILGIGSNDGAPIPTQDGFLKDNRGNIVVPKLNRDPMETLARLNNGRYTDVSLSDDDLQFLLSERLGRDMDTTRLTEREFDQWHDRGPLLALLILPLALLGFRRGWLLFLPLLFVIQPNNSYALEWQDLWQRPDQRAAKALQQGDAETAAELFDDEQWRATSHYKAGNYEQAAETFARHNSADAHYNRGNALARAGQLDEAIKAYEQALQQQPDMDDALTNKALLEQLKQQQQSQPQKDGEQNAEQDSAEQENSGQQNADQQNGESSQDNASGQQNDGQSSDQSNASDNSNDDNTPPSDPASETDTEQAESQNNREAAADKADDDTNASAQQAETDPAADNAEPMNAETLQTDQQSRQQQQAMEQWLRKIPDDPSGLLKRKFNYEYRVRQQRGETQQEQPQW